MEKLDKVIIVLLLTFFSVQKVDAKNIPKASEFIDPLNYNYKKITLGWGGYNSAFPGKKHVATDRSVPVGTKVYASANGVVRFARASGLCPSWIFIIVVEHILPNGKKICTIYGHTKPSVKEGNIVTIGQEIGEIVAYCYGDHLHFGIYMNEYKPGYNNGYPNWIKGYMFPNDFPGNYIDPLQFINNHNSSYRKHTAGTLIKCSTQTCKDQDISATIYQLDEVNGKIVKRPFYAFSAFDVRNYDDDDYVEVTDKELSLYATGEPLMIPEGTVVTVNTITKFIIDSIQDSTGKTVYLKRPINNDDYSTLGFSDKYYVYDYEISSDYYKYSVELKMNGDKYPLYPIGCLLKEQGLSTVYQIIEKHSTGHTLLPFC